MSFILLNDPVIIEPVLNGQKNNQMPFCLSVTEHQFGFQTSSNNNIQFSPPEPISIGSVRLNKNKLVESSKLSLA